MANLTKRSARKRLPLERPLPPHVHKVTSRGREYYYFQLNRQTDEAGPRIKLNDPWCEAELAQALRLSGGRVELVEIEQQLRLAFQSAKGRAQANRLEFGLDLPFLLSMLNRQGHRCAVSGLHFETCGYANSWMAPFALSLDRVDSSKGYIKDNVRLVCRIANFAMGQWGLPALERLAEAIASERRRRTSREPAIVKLVKHDNENTLLLGKSDD